MSQTKPCPYCAEDILAAARKCKHCGSDLSHTSEPPCRLCGGTIKPGRVKEKDGGVGAAVLITVGILALLFVPFGIIVGPILIAIGVLVGAVSTTEVDGLVCGGRRAGGFRRCGERAHRLG